MKDEHQKNKGRSIRRRRLNEDEHVRNVKFDISKAPPAEHILQKIRGKASIAHVHIVEAGIDADTQVDTASRKRKRIDESCGKDEEHMRRGCRVEGTTKQTDHRRTLIDHLEHKAAKQLHDKNARIQKHEKAKGDDKRQGDQKAGTSSAREPSRSFARTLAPSRQESEAESITRLIANLR